MPVAETKPSGPAQKPGGIVVVHRPRWFQRLAARVIFILIRGISLTLRYRWHDRERYFDDPKLEHAIYCIWHNRLALCLEVYSRYISRHSRSRGLAAIVSASKDGALLASVLECFKVQPVRGSSSRRGPQALLELRSWAERGYDVAFTPDGPRGPRYVAHSGIISLAQLTGLLIIPVSYNLNWKIQVKSWDRFQIPLPFARCDVAFGKPIQVPRECLETDREKWRLQLENELKDMSKD